MADPAALRESLADALKGEHGRYTLAFSLPGWQTAKRRYHLDVDIHLPLVTGFVRLDHRMRSPIDGRVILLDRHKGPQQSEGWRKGAYVFTLQNNPEEVRVEFDLSFSNGWGDFVTSVREVVSSHESDDLCRRLARLLVRTPEQLEQADSLCDQLAEARDPADRLAYAEALWAHARLLLLIGEDGAGAECAAEGAEQAARSGRPLSRRMFQSGHVLTSSLKWFHQTEAARQVRRSLPEA
ncbi:hypothetical protein OG749_17445 [Streptomyces nojiriensis]|uniref:hypothetical protein n=1 Tax=Streptomyces nojiriensis TaxID=66374 RepID=UPI002E1737AB